MLKDSLYNYGMTTRLMEIESEFKQKENKMIIAKQTEVIKLKEEVIARQRHLNLLTALLVLITFAFSTYLFRHYRKNKRLNIVLDQRVTERTRELEMSRNSLLNQLKQRELVIDRVSSGLREQVCTLRALHSIAISEVSDPIALQYIERFDVASSKMEDLRLCCPRVRST